MDTKFVTNRIMCFIVKNNEALCWLLKNISDIVDIIQWISILLS